MTVGTADHGPRSDRLVPIDAFGLTALQSTQLVRTPWNARSADPAPDFRITPLQGRPMNPFARSMTATTRMVRHATIVAVLLAGAGAAHADAVTDWNEIAESTVIEATPDPFLQTRSTAIAQVAVFEAVNAVVGGYEPYLGTVTAAPGASPEAATIAAAHRALATLHPDQAAELDALRTEALAEIPDGPCKQAGVAVGEAAAAAVLAARENDGSDDDTPYVPGTRPGQYRPTPPDHTPAFRPGLGSVTPFAIRSAVRFRVRPPPPLRSGRYARDYDEVKRVGDVDSGDSGERPHDRADVARFYAVADAPLWSDAARQVSKAQGRTLAENARTFALLNIAIFDAVVACFDSKYFYDYWRPVTAIRLGDTDGNRRTGADGGWLSYVFTPPFPSYPSGHATFGGAARHVLEQLLGEDGHAIVLTHPQVPDIVLHYGSWKQIADDIDDGRVYGGVHYRFDQEAGARQGRRVGRYVLRHSLRPIGRHAGDGGSS